jgi:hypothetical protein
MQRKTDYICAKYIKGNFTRRIKTSKHEAVTIATKGNRKGKGTGIRVVGQSVRSNKRAICARSSAISTRTYGGAETNAAG